MANELHRKILVAEADVDFDTNAGEIDGVASGDMVWCAPITTLEDCDVAEFFPKIKVGTLSAAGTIEFYYASSGSSRRVGQDFATLTDHGEATADTVVAQLKQCLDLVKVIGTTGDDDAKTFDVSFEVFNPGGNGQLFIYNGTGAAFASGGSEHGVRVRGWGPELQ